MRFRKTRAGFGTLAALVVTLIAAGCGGDEASSETPTTFKQPANSEAETDVPEGLEPKPLDEPATVRVVRSNLYEYFAPFELGVVMGEFEKENITIEATTATPSDGLVLLASGQVDVLASALSAGTMNAMVSSPIRMVAMGYSSAPETKAGLWVRRDKVEDPDTGELDLSKLKGARVGSTTGAGSPTSLPIAAALEDVGLSIGDIEFVKLGGSDLVLALENGSLDAAWLTDPLWTEAVGNPDLAHAFNDSGLGLTGYLFGDRLLSQDREVGEAFVRAMVRTSQLYLQGDYHANDDVAPALAKALDVPLDVMRGAPSNKFDPNLSLKPELAELAQKTYLVTPDVLSYDRPRPADEVFDAGFLEAVVGQ